MARTALLMLGLGIAGWFWSSGELEKLGAYPTHLGMMEALQEYPAARMDVMRYGCAAMVALGALLLIMPGRR